MRTHEDDVARTLKALVPEPPRHLDFADIARRRRRRSRTQLLVPLVAAAVTAAVVVPLALTSGSGGSAPSLASPTPGAESRRVGRQRSPYPERRHRLCQDRRP